MAETASFEPGGYRYVRGPFQYSGGVAAEAGFVVERASFARPLPIVEGFAAIEAHEVTHFCGAPVVLNLLANAPAVFDMIYQPALTPLLAKAADAGW